MCAYEVVYSPTEQAQRIFVIRAQTEKERAAFEEGTAARRAQFSMVGELLQRARALGVSDDKVVSAPRQARLRARDILAVMEGDYVPLAREGHKAAAARLTELQALLAERGKAALAAIFRKDPAIAKSVDGKLRESSKRRTEGDKLVLSLAVDDGRARHLHGTLGQLGNATARRESLSELCTKGGGSQHGHN